MRRFSFGMAVMLACITVAHAEVAEITVAQQYGVSFLPLMVMEREGLIEKQAQAAGLAEPPARRPKR